MQSEEFEVKGSPGLEDPIWEYMLETRLRPYIDAVRDWWLHMEELDVHQTGLSEITEAPPGLMVRFTKSPIKSPIKGIQAFPFIPTGYLQLRGIQGGSTKMVTRICLNNKFKIDEFTIVEKHNLPSTFNQGQFVAFIPTSMLENIRMLGSFVYLTPEEMANICQYPELMESIKQKLLLKL